MFLSVFCLHVFLTFVVCACLCFCLYLLFISLCEPVYVPASANGIVFRYICKMLSAYRMLSVYKLLLAY